MGSWLSIAWKRSPRGSPSKSPRWPTNEYEKLADMEVSPGPDDVVMRLKAKPGTRFDPSEIATCLDHTLATIEEQ